MPDMPTEFVMNVKTIELSLDAITPYWRNPRENEVARAGEVHCALGRRSAGVGVCRGEVADDANRHLHQFGA